MYNAYKIINKSIFCILCYIILKHHLDFRITIKVELKHPYINEFLENGFYTRLT